MRLTFLIVPLACLIYVMLFPTARTRAMLLRLLAEGIERQLPLEALVHGLAAESGWWERYRLQQLARRLGSGFSVPEALDSMNSFFPPSVAAAAFTAESCGTLPQTLRLCADEWDVDQEHLGRQFALSLGYLAFLIAATQGLVGLIASQRTRLISTFQDFLKESKGPSPLFSDQFLEIVSQVLNWSEVLTLLVIASLILRNRRFLSRIFSGERLVSVTAARSYLSQPRAGTSLLLRALRVPVKCGQPLVTAFRALALHHPFPFMRPQIQTILDRVEQGVSPWEALRELRFLNPAEHGLLQLAERNGHLEWTLGELAGTLERRRTRRWDVLMSFVQPIVVILLGLIVGSVVLSILFPLFLLFENLSR